MRLSPPVPGDAGGGTSAQAPNTIYRMSLHHGPTDLCDNRFTVRVYSSRVPGIFPIQLEILSTGQPYF